MFGKIFSSMYDGTLATVGPWEALVTFQQLIVLSDQYGIVDMTMDAISRRTTIPLEVIRTGIAALEQPDLQSRTPDEDGRRIVRLVESRPWGWRIVNYAHYRAIRTADDRREYHRQYAKKRRAQGAVNKNQDVSTLSTTVKPNQPIAEAEAEGKAEAEAEEKKRHTVSPKSKRASHQSFEEWFAEIKEYPAYHDIDCDNELSKMQAWLTTPKARGRKLTRNFVLNWLNKIDPGESAKAKDKEAREGKDRMDTRERTPVRLPFKYCNAHRTLGCWERIWPKSLEEAEDIKRLGWQCDTHKGLPMEYDESTGKPK